MRNVLKMALIVLTVSFAFSAQAYEDCSKLGDKESYAYRSCENDNYLESSLRQVYGKKKSELGTVTFGSNPKSVEKFVPKTTVKVKVEKTMTLTEVKAYKFDPAMSTIRTAEKTSIAKTLIERFDLFKVYGEKGGEGVRAILTKNGLDNQYSPHVHAGNIFIYMYSFSMDDFALKVGLSKKETNRMKLTAQKKFNRFDITRENFVYTVAWVAKGELKLATLNDLGCKK